MDASLPNYSFGYLVRRYRQALDLTQTDLARQVGCALVTISKIERDERRPSRQMAGILAERLNIPAADRDLFIAIGLGERAADNLALQTEPASAPAVTHRRRHNLPAPTTQLVGREQDLREIRTILLRPDVRLLTLTGPAGAGKTRLSLEAASQALDEFADGVSFVPLAPVGEPDLVASAISDALGVSEAGGLPMLEVLIRFLQDKHLLLLLDNFEHLLGAVSHVEAMLAAAPGLKVLTTSRARLRVYGEHAYTVVPLALPEIQMAPVAAEALLDYGACRLFLERARAIKPEFSATEEDARAVAEICIQLDGLPLAIELAAARVRLLPPRKMLEQLSSRLRFLTRGAADAPARHRTLRHTIDWSYELLEADEQRLFLRLAIFPGGCTLDAAEIVGNMEGDIDVLSALESLVDKSLLTQNEAGDEPRFTMLETFREYALERLDADGDADGTNRTFTHYCVRLAEAANTDLRAGTADAALELLEAEHDNLRAALRWAHERHEAELELKLAATLWRFWEIRGYFTEGRQRLEQALAAGAQTSPELLADAHTGAGTMAYNQSDYRAAIAHHEAALALYRQLGNDEGIAFALNNLGAQAVDLADYEAAERWLGESLAIAQRIGHKRLVCYVLSNQADIAKQRREYAHAADILAKCLDMSYELGDGWMVAAALAWRGTALLHTDAQAQAADDLMTSLEHCVRIGARQYAAIALEGLAFLAAHRKLPEACTQLCGAAEALRKEIGITLLPHAHQEHDVSTAYGQEALSTDAFAEAWAQGAALMQGDLLVETVKTFLNEDGQGG